MIDFTLNGWSAWTPGRPARRDMLDWLEGSGSTVEELRGETEPQIEAVPDRQLRRCSEITRLGLKAAFDSVRESDYAPDEVQLVWITRHGEIGVTIDLLRDLANDEMLMPMSFSNSVPNTPPAYYDIATDNTLTTRAVCGGPDSFHQGLVDAAGLLRTSPEHPVLVVHADGLLPEPLEPFNKEYDVPFGVGLVLERPEKGPSIGFSLHSEDDGSARPDEPPVFTVLRWYLGSSDRTTIQSNHNQWVWQRSE